MWLGMAKRSKVVEGTRGRGRSHMLVKAGEGLVMEHKGHRKRVLGPSPSSRGRGVGGTFKELSQRRLGIFSPNQRLPRIGSWPLHEAWKCFLGPYIFKKWSHHLKDKISRSM